MKINLSSMSQGKKIFGGILLILLAVGLFFLAASPDFAVLSIPLWKCFLGVACIAWLASMLKKPGAGIVFPVAALFLLFEKEIGTLAGIGENFVNNWLVIVGVLVLYAALKLLLEESLGIPKKIGDKFSDKIEYLDADKTSFDVSSSIGDVNIYFQNTDSGKTDPMTLTIHSGIGDCTIHVPAEWNVIVHKNASIGDSSVRPNPTSPTRTLTINVASSIGDLRVV
ncbi:MAG: hypothetical protein KBS45_02195 [Clostridiales bacterium]|nr:hypothetical protein [Candidatus Coliplasma caballi]